jgi:GT2 family glycosyltransferase/glycosyltransferase involved in cell wall biosynthesis
MSPVDIIVPVYRGLTETRRCIESVLAAPVKTDFQLIVIDDRSPEPELVVYLDSLAAEKRITLLRNADNLGFVATVNKGMQLHPDRDVLLLNSDAEVANDWLDRIYTAAYSAEEIGTVTPFSNNATICSYPYFNGAGNASIPSGLTLAELDHLASTVNAGQTAQIPTAVGFCMFIKRACLDEVGYFDAGRFGRGYGEENDFSRRAVLLGWHNVLAADVFVFHAGGVSFGHEQGELQRDAMAALLDAQPDYLYHIRAFMLADPLAYLRDSIDRARFNRGSSEADLVLAERSASEQADRFLRQCSGSARLHITHSWGGGIERWIEDFSHADALHCHYLLCSVTDPDAAGGGLELWRTHDGEKIRLGLWKLASPIRATDINHAEYGAILQEVIDFLAVRSVIVSSLIGHSLEALTTQLPTVVVLHDMYPFCPAIFANYEGVACKTCNLASLQTCHQHNPMYVFWNNTVPESWVAFRQQYLLHLQAPWIHLVAPTQFARDRWFELLPGLRHLPCAVIGHGIFISHFNALPNVSSRQEGEKAKLRIVIPGRLLIHKGLHLLDELLPGLTKFAEILLLGSGDFGMAFSNFPGVTVVRHYAHEDLTSQISTFKPDCALLLSVVPETFSYTLSEMQALALPVVATRLGAFAERIEHGKSGWLVAPRAEAVEKQLRELFAQRDLLESVARYLSVNRPPNIYAMLRGYQELLPEKQEPRSYLARGIERIALEHENRVNELTAERQHLHLQLSNANMVLQQHELSLASKDMALGQLTHQLDGLSHEYEHLNAEFRSVLESRSWTWTAPLRIFVHIFRCWLRLVIKPSPAPLVTVDSLMHLPESGDSSEMAVDSEQVAMDAPTIEEGRGVAPLLEPEGGAVKQKLNRAEFCTQIGLPQATGLILLRCIGDTSPISDALFDLMKACLTASNSLQFIISEADFAKLLESNRCQDLRVMAAQRHLIPVPIDQGGGDLDSFVDICMLTGSVSKDLPKAVCEILREVGFLVVSESLIILPEFRLHKRVLWLSQVAPSDALTRVLDWFAKGRVQRMQIVAQAREEVPCVDTHQT